jgi:hypothetical protein
MRPEKDRVSQSADDLTGLNMPKTDANMNLVTVAHQMGNTAA